MKRILYFILAVLLVLSLGSCKLWDMLFYKAPGVSPKDLASYSGTLPATRDDTLMTIGEGGELAFGAALEHVMSSTAWESVMPSEANSVLGSLPTMKLLAPLLSRVKDKSIAVSQQGMNDSSLHKEFHLDIQDEAVVGTGLSGTLTIDRCTIDLIADLSAASPPLTADAEADADCLVTAAGLKSTSVPGFTVNSARIGAKAKGNVTVGVGTTGPTSVEWNLSADANAGFSISDSRPGYFSGKFIIEADYYDKGSLDAAQLTDPATGISNIEFTITIKVYDNDNELVYEYELNEDDLATVMGS